MLFEFRKGVSVGTARKHIQNVYLDHATGIRVIKLSRFHQANFILKLQPHFGKKFLASMKTLCLHSWTINRWFPKKRLLRVWKPLFQLSFLIWWGLVRHSPKEQNTLDHGSAAMYVMLRHEMLRLLDRISDEKGIIYDSVTNKDTNKVVNVQNSCLNHSMKVMLSFWWNCRCIIHWSSSIRQKSSFNEILRATH